MKLKIAASLALFVFCGCAHQYGYVPEVKGDGAMHARGAVVYSIPSDTPVVKMEVVSLGMGKPKPQHENDQPVEMLQVRVFFQRVNEASCASIQMIPSEQSIQFTDGVTIRPSVVHAAAQSADKKEKQKSDKKAIAQKNKVAQHSIRLACQKNHAVEFFFALPKKKDEPTEVQSFTFQWKLHYGKSLASQTTRFDREDSRSQNSVDPATFQNDQFYPYDATLPIDPTWIGNDWYWLDPAAIQPNF